ncbi:MAG: hypothetical protein Q9210_004739 [Variospora velana]
MRLTQSFQPQQQQPDNPRASHHNLAHTFNGASNVISLPSLPIFSKVLESPFTNPLSILSSTAKSPSRKSGYGFLDHLSANPFRVITLELHAFVDEFSGMRVGFRTE